MALIRLNGVTYRASGILPALTNSNNNQTPKKDVSKEDVNKIDVTLNNRELGAEDSDDKAEAIPSKSILSPLDTKHLDQEKGFRFNPEVEVNYFHKENTIGHDEEEDTEELHEYGKKYSNPTSRKYCSSIAMYNSLTDEDIDHMAKKNVARKEKKRLIDLELAYYEFYSNLYDEAGYDDYFEEVFKTTWDLYRDTELNCVFVEESLKQLQRVYPAGDKNTDAFVVRDFKQQCINDLIIRHLDQEEAERQQKNKDERTLKKVDFSLDQLLSYYSSDQVDPPDSRETRGNVLLRIKPIELSEKNAA